MREKWPLAHLPPGAAIERRQLAWFLPSSHPISGLASYWPNFFFFPKIKKREKVTECFFVCMEGVRKLLGGDDR